MTSLNNVVVRSNSDIMFQKNKKPKQRSKGVASHKAVLGYHHTLSSQNNSFHGSQTVGNNALDNHKRVSKTKQSSYLQDMYHRRTSSYSAKIASKKTSPNDSYLDYLTRDHNNVTSSTKLSDQRIKLKPIEGDDSSCLTFYKQVKNPIFQPIPVCGSKHYPSHSVHCYQSLVNVNPSSPSRNSYTVKNAVSTVVRLGVTCSFRNIAVNGQSVMQALRDCARNCDVRSSKSLFLLDSKKTQCPIPTISMLMASTEEHDYTRNFVQELLMLNSKKRLEVSKCDQWVNKTALFFIANEPYNVYFQFMTYYNVFTTVKQLGSTNPLAASKESEVVLFRLSDATDYRFGKLERSLFPQLRVLSDLSRTSNATMSNFTCFQRVIKVPWAYSAFPFRCVVDGRLRNETLRCYNNSKRVVQHQVQNQGPNPLDSGPGPDADSKDMHNLPNRLSFLNDQSRLDTAQNLEPNMMLFRSLVLRACDVVPNSLRAIIGGKQKSPMLGEKSLHFPLNVVLIKRKPYVRHRLDHPSLFQRVLSNEQDLINAMMHNISRDLLNLTSAFMEELDICEQVRVAHNADVIIGVHGAGLVHLWWMRNSGVVLELVPPRKLSRPTYKVLASLAGKRYYGVVLDKSMHKHQNNVSVSVVIETLHSIIETVKAVAG